MCSLKSDLMDCVFLCKFKYLRTQLKKQNLHRYTETEDFYAFMRNLKVCKNI